MNELEKHRAMQRKLIQLAMSDEETTVQELKNKMAEILMSDITPMQIISGLAESKTIPDRFSIKRALAEINEG